MKFKKQFPPESGHYWYVNTDYPIPVIGFIQDECLYDGDQRYNSQDKSTQRFIRIGDMIETPDYRDNEIE